MGDNIFIRLLLDVNTASTKLSVSLVFRKGVAV